MRKIEKLKAGKLFSIKIPISKIVNPEEMLSNNISCLEHPKFSKIW